jgi:DNA-binding response OmpR family regulator
MRRILIVEDDEFMADIYRDKLQAEGFTAEICRNGLDAIERLRTRPPDLVLLDVMLPGANGAEVLGFIRTREATRNLPVIIMSNAYEYARDQMADVWREGADQFLTKADCTPARLIQEVRSALVAAGKPATTAAPPPASAATAAAGPGAGALQPEVRQQIIAKLPDRLGELYGLLQELLNADEAARPVCLTRMVPVARSLAAMAGVASLNNMARMASALEAMLIEMVQKPAKLTPSAMRTMAQAVDFLSSLHPRRAAPSEQPPLSPLIMVIDDEPISRETVCLALKRVFLRAVSLSDPQVALRVLEETRFDLVFVDVGMPGMSGFDLCEKLHATEENARTPVVFVTSLSDFETRIHSTKSGGVDFITKPIAVMELGVKALLRVIQGS